MSSLLSDVGIQSSSRRFEIAVVRERPCSSRSWHYGINSLSSIDRVDAGFG